MIYAEYGKAPAERAIPAAHVALPEASAVFEEWLAQQGAPSIPAASDARAPSA